MPAETDGGGRWSLDHLFLDQDGIPTFVEVKRSTDTRIRREVIGQMLDYAANGVAYWPVESIRAMYEARVQAAGLDAVATLAEFLGPSSDPEALWASVKVNLQAGRVRLVFVADEIPPQIRHELKKLEQRDARRRTGLEVFPSGEQVGSEGAVISVDHQVNVLKRLGLPDNAVSRGLFGALLSEPLAELVVQGTRDEQTGFIAQFTFYMSLQQVRKAGLRTGLRVGCILQSLSLPNDKRVWKASDVRVL